MGECKAGLHGESAMSLIVVKRLEDIGRAKEKLRIILDDEIFETTSKHNPYWQSEHEQEADKLDDLRMKLACLNDNLWDIWSVLRQDNDTELE